MTYSPTFLQFCLYTVEEMNQQVPTDYSTIPDLKWKDSFLGLNTMQNIVRLWKNA